MSDSCVEQLSARDKRCLLFNLLYSAEASDYQIPITDILAGYQHEFECVIQDDSSVVTTLQAIIEQKETLDVLYQPLLSNWKFERLGVPTRLILRFATWELSQTDTQPLIIINEAIELAKSFAEKDSYKFINGILEQLAKKLHRLP